MTALQLNKSKRKDLNTQVLGLLYAAYMEFEPIEDEYFHVGMVGRDVWNKPAGVCVWDYNSGRLSLR
eukprot:106076-Chlamydomonas_euryale.AAC.1